MWAIPSLASISMTDVLFAMDCSDLIALTSNPEDLTSFRSELRDFMYYMDSFMSFMIRFIPHSENVCAGHLAKCARARGFCFFFSYKLISS